MSSGKTIFLKITELVPLAVFLTLQRLIPERYGVIFTSSFIATIITLPILYFSHYVMNRLYLGIHYYLLAVFFLYITKLEPYNSFFSEIRGLGMIIFMLITGAVTFWTTRYSFIGIEPVSGKSGQTASFLLMTAVILCGFIMYLMRYIFKFPVAVTEIIPFVILFSIQCIIKKYMSKPGN